MSSQHANVQTSRHTASRTASHAAQGAAGDAALHGERRSSGFDVGNSYKGRQFGGVSRHQLEMLRFANLQALRILARD